MNAEVGRKYDRIVDNLKVFIEDEGNKLSEQVTAALLPCTEAHAAYSTAMDVTCGEKGAVKLLLGFVCVLALNLLFISLLYSAAFALAFFQSMQIERLSNQLDGSYEFVEILTTFGSRNDM